MIIVTYIWVWVRDYGPNAWLRAADVVFYSIRVPNLIKIGKSYKVTHLAVHGLKYVGGWSLLEDHLYKCSTQQIILGINMQLWPFKIGVVHD